MQFHKEKMTFSMDDHTKVKEGKKELSFFDLKKRMWASVEYKKEGNKLVTESFHVSMPKAKTVKKEEKLSEKATENKGLGGGGYETCFSRVQEPERPRPRIY